jgi:hypothetical protein
MRERHGEDKMRTKKDIAISLQTASRTCVFGATHAPQFGDLAAVSRDPAVSMTRGEIGAPRQPLPNGS